MAEALERYLDIQKIKNLKTSAYHPRTNGLVERLNGQIGEIFRKKGRKDKG